MSDDDLGFFKGRLAILGLGLNEAAYMAESQVSWQMCFVGDPLYRPFARRQ